MASTETSRSTEAYRRTDGPAPTCWGRTLHSVPAHATHERVCPESIISPESGQGVLHTRYSATMAGCLIAAIDAVRTASDYAKTKRDSRSTSGGL